MFKSIYYDEDAIVDKLLHPYEFYHNNLHHFEKGSIHLKL